MFPKKRILEDCECEINDVEVSKIKLKKRRYAHNVASITYLQDTHKQLSQVENKRCKLSRIIELVYFLCDIGRDVHGIWKEIEDETD